MTEREKTEGGGPGDETSPVGGHRRVVGTDVSAAGERIRKKNLMRRCCRAVEKNAPRPADTRERRRAMSDDCGDAHKSAARRRRAVGGGVRSRVARENNITTTGRNSAFNGNRDKKNPGTTRRRHKLTARRNSKCLIIFDETKRPVTDIAPRPRPPLGARKQNYK